MTTADIPARIFRLHFETDQGQKIEMEPRTYRQINRTVGPLVNKLADQGGAYNIAVLDDNDDDMTHLFPCFT